MSKTIFCKKFQEELPALEIPPMPGARGQELMSTISQKAWDEWKSHQTTLINEKRLDMSNSDSRMWLVGEMEKFFNNEDYEKASGFKALE
ncbi:oxidative damage protection protein [Gammaproteobacteria bacterium]|jgi:Fe-S cluster biosynthesis and repair protein YggX|nr:oxidative damage protection protein [Euryarchaeota archaeon]MDA8884480.1 oxidative damage protection protein [Gammaproteobacteria bacterium]MDB4252917.1 oxidative damage protection protein [Gammaproteobacteria bacterium]MDB9861589.1 oxidative damage protection protein [Gammaproteobacteria bacterium]MDB9997185.1 oxidative damage protection protein [Gammaproteobacteria bacterium]|tara:strand:- start:549 stop:818 length:270 start_codon:yes stop_codon:yes gene_type:complete